MGDGGQRGPAAPDFPARTAPAVRSVAELDAAVTTCRACPRLVAWREEVGRLRRRAFRDWEYWARPVPGFGPVDAPLALVGLAPAAHGGNRTGRVFTGDPSGDALYAALYDLGLASQPTATHRGDGLRLHGVRIMVPVHCAPPENRPTTEERARCGPWLARELALLRPGPRAVVALGGFAWRVLLPLLADAGWRLPRPRPVFGHGVEVTLADAAGAGRLHLVGGYHPSQRNMSTRTLTPAGLRAVLHRGARLAGLDTVAPPGEAG
ncbi:uracil-DNA glycosylase [Streptomyces sp. DSM 44915]|uniref:Type-5 uracil-DNA glycosylase n=1 Tax=Streptomyces chisholmiae TaxID=3075540 RepID=A0ABU2JIQ4_9ACTN|nr:uracil-DNA glycosylase [Streptomyces sp. DSM 44915]MDT0264866.1 uracil-DNA glycosylase [Streptomyces sp. DSM 44915]